MLWTHFTAAGRGGADTAAHSFVGILLARVPATFELFSRSGHSSRQTMTPARSLRRVFRGSGTARSRFHDEGGNRLPIRELRHLPASVFYAIRARLTGGRAELPWITWNAMERLEELLREDWRMVEFGSGASTRWFARRVASLHSIEDDPQWFDRVRPSLPAGVRYELRQGSEYWDLSDHPDESLDLVVVDGIHREKCVTAAVPKLKPGGWIFLDDTDKGDAAGGDEHRRARQNLRVAANETGGSLETATGLVIGNPVLAQQWTLAQLPEAQSQAST